MNHRAGATEPNEITLQDFAQTWVLGRHLEQKVTGLRAQIIEVNGADFWVRRLTKSGKLAQRAQHNGAPVAFILYPVIAASEWRYVSPRPAQVHQS